MRRGVDAAETTDATTLAYHAFPLERPQARDRLPRDLPLARFEIVDEGGSVDIVLQHVVVVECLLFEHLLGNQEIDRAPGGVGSHEQRAPVDLAQHRAVDLHERMRPDHLEIENDPFRDERFSESTQDVHDVLGLHSSERPREQHDVERRPWDLDGRRRRRREPDALGELGRQGLSRGFDGVFVRIKGEDACGMLRDRHRQPAVATADLEDACAGEVDYPFERREVRSFGIEDARLIQSDPLVGLGRCAAGAEFLCFPPRVLELRARVSIHELPGLDPPEYAAACVGTARTKRGELESAGG